MRSLRSYMNPEVGDPSVLERLGHELVQGRLIVIRDAFQPAFAERLHACLDASPDWELHEDDSHPHFRYRHHNLYDESRFPDDLRWCHGILQSAETKELVHRLTARDCAGRGQFSASWYRPGDYSLPHNDLVASGVRERRQVAMVWHLTKGWAPSWGGDFYWCPAGRYVPPSFNTLLLFTVRPESAHFVAAVSPRAQGKRLAINGWWTGKAAGSDPGNAHPEADPIGRLIEVV